MIDIDTFGIIGGDKRQLAAARMVANDGYTVHLSCFEKLDMLLNSLGGSIEIDECIICSDVVILPLPVTKDGVTLNTPFSTNRIIMNDEFAKLFKGKIVFCPMKDKLIKTSRHWQDVKVYDFLIR